MENLTGLGWLLLTAGLMLSGVGLVLILFPKIPWLGQLPGDIRFVAGKTRFYFPIVTCVVLSLLLTLLLWAVRWLFRR